MDKSEARPRWCGDRQKEQFSAPSEPQAVMLTTTQAKAKNNITGRRSTNGRLSFLTSANLTISTRNLVFICHLLLVTGAERTPQRSVRCHPGDVDIGRERCTGARQMTRGDAGKTHKATTRHKLTSKSYGWEGLRTTIAEARNLKRKIPLGI